MKKLSFIFLYFILLYVACSDNDIPVTDPQQPEEPEEPTIVYDIPTVRITGIEGEIEKDNYKTGTITIESKDENGNRIETLLEATTEIKGRGNSTWNEAKKPYRLKLKDKAEILGMPANKHWVLLANFFDKTLVRNELAFEISNRMEFEYTPRMQFADFYLNNVYRGSYMIGEHIRVDKERVNIAESSDINTGYLLEIDERKGEPYWFPTNIAGTIFCIKSPEDITPEQMDYITNHVQKMEDILYAGGANMASELEKYVDMKTFIDYYLLNELSNNVDGNLRLSTFLYKKKNDDKLYFGPVWDYDLAFGNAAHENSNGDKTDLWNVRNRSEWYKKFFENAELEARTKSRWKELRASKLKDLDEFINLSVKKLSISQVKNFNVWDINWEGWTNIPAKGSYSNEVVYLKNWLTARIAWMDNQWK